MPLFSVNGHSVLFAHIPKCGGTSITEMLIAHPKCNEHDYLRKGRSAFTYPLTKCPPQHWHTSMLSERLLLERFDLVFSVLRDPLDRMLSEHVMCLRRGDSVLTDFNAWYLEARALRSGNPFAWDNHLRPAREFILPQSVLYALEAGLENIWADICRRLAIDPAASATQHSLARGSSGASRSVVSREISDFVMKDYREDFRLHSLVIRRHHAKEEPASFAELEPCLSPA